MKVVLATLLALQLYICYCSLLGLRKKEIREIQKAWEIFSTYPNVGTDLTFLMMDVVKLNVTKNTEESKEILKNGEYHDNAENTTINGVDLLPKWIGTFVSELGNDETTAQNLADISNRYKYSYSKKQLKISPANDVTLPQWGGMCIPVKQIVKSQVQSCQKGIYREIAASFSLLGLSYPIVTIKPIYRLGGRILAVMKKKMKDRLTRAAEVAIRKGFRAAIELMDP